MITFEQARDKILEQIAPMPQTDVRVERLAGYVNATDVVAAYDSPMFDNSAVDGYGVLAGDLQDAGSEKPVRLSLAGTIRAGDRITDCQLKSGHAFKILTGAAAPPSVEAVVMREFCQEENGNVLISKSVRAGENIRRRGDEYLRGKVVLGGGCRLTPGAVALIASQGYKTFPVYKQPRGAVVTTGNELVKPGRRLMPGQVFDSNSFAMHAALKSDGVGDILTLHASESLSSTKEAFIRALRFADVVVSTGGVSVGEFDFVKAALEEIGVQTEIWRIAIKPGKPVYYGIFAEPKGRRKKYIFGLPGNPVSALVTYHQLVKPAIAKLRGLANYANPLLLSASLARPLRKNAGRMEFVRGNLFEREGNFIVEPTTGQDSHMLGGMAGANCLIHFPLEATTLDAGATVKVQQLDW